MVGWEYAEEIDQMNTDRVKKRMLFRHECAKKAYEIDVFKSSVV